MGRVVPENIRELAFGSISGSYAQVGANFANPARLLIFDSTLDVPVYISFNGRDDQMYFRADQQAIIDVSSNASAPDDRFRFSKSAGIYVRDAGTAPGSGTFRVSVFTDASYGV